MVVRSMWYITDKRNYAVCLQKEKHLKYVRALTGVWWENKNLTNVVREYSDKVAINVQFYD